jgi:hypothetical protein
MRRGVSFARGAAVLAALAVAFVGLALVTAQDAASELTLVLGGDVIFDAPIEYALRRTERSRDEPTAYAPVFEDLGPVLAAADYAIVNLETPVATRTRSSEAGDAPRFAAPHAFLSAVARAGVDAVTLANNHAYDQGVAGLSETLAAVDAEHLAAIGAGETPSRARYVRVRDRTLALLGWAEGTNWRVLEEEPDAPRVAILDAERIATEVSAARGRADFVAVAFHWTEGREHVPSPRMRRLAQAAANAGADLVWGHGTHLPERASVLRSADGRTVPVIWSLGNLVAVMNSDDDDVFSGEPSVRESWLARLTLRAVGPRLEVASIEAVPFWIGISERDDAEPFVRPLSLTREREFLARSRCGRRCDRLEGAYAARAERAMGALALEVPPPEAPAGALAAGALASDERLASATLTPAPGEAHALAAPVASDARAEPERPLDELAAETPPPLEAASTARHARAGPPRPPAPRLASDLGELASGSLSIRWQEERATEVELDEPLLARLVAALRADGRLRLEIVAHPSGPLDRELWARRGARARGLVAIRGPSRSRVSSRLGSPEATGHLSYRLVR